MRCKFLIRSYMFVYINENLSYFCDNIYTYKQEVKKLLSRKRNIICCDYPTLKLDEADVRDFVCEADGFF